MLCWLDTSSDAEALALAKPLVAHYEAGLGRPRPREPWEEELRWSRRDPTRRAKIALESLPRRGSFEEAVEALRFLIADAPQDDPKRRNDELRLLHWLAAVHTLCEREVPGTPATGYAVIERIPAKRLLAANLHYVDIGYRKIPLLTGPDIQLMTEAWGEPRKHLDPYEACQRLWDTSARIVQQHFPMMRRSLRGA